MQLLGCGYGCFSVALSVCVAWVLLLPACGSAATLVALMGYKSVFPGPGAACLQSARAAVRVCSRALSQKTLRGARAGRQRESLCWQTLLRIFGEATQSGFQDTHPTLVFQLCCVGAPAGHRHHHLFTIPVSSLSRTRPPGILPSLLPPDHQRNSRSKPAATSTGAAGSGLSLNL